MPEESQADPATADSVAEVAGGSLPPPTRRGARFRLAALLVLGVGCLATAWQLRGSAAYALVTAGPLDLGHLANAELNTPSARGAWVRGTAELEPDAVSFERRGEPGSLLLGRIAERRDLWVLLPVASGTSHYFPPRVLEGRLLSRAAMGLRLRPIVDLMQARGAGPSDHLLVVGSRPAEHRLDLVLLLLLTILGALASIRFTLLMLPVRSTATQSTVPPS